MHLNMKLQTFPSGSEKDLVKRDKELYLRKDEAARQSKNTSTYSNGPKVVLVFYLQQTLTTPSLNTESHTTKDSYERIICV